jgi:ubiquinone/menaquinone biosynthesis C-methylase UbiE
MFRGPQQIRDAYRNDAVAKGYLAQRFREPLGALLHAAQAAVLRRELARARPATALEIAPGPARLTFEAAAAFRGTAVALDASAQMLHEARSRLAAAGHTSFRFVHGDAFALPFRACFDFAYTFRFIRHFESDDRRRIYAELARVLRPGGRLLFDAVNERVSAALRAAAPGEYKHFDALHRPDGLRNELQAAGFRVLSLEGVQHRYALLQRVQILVAPRSRALARLLMEVVDRCGGEPLEWIVTCVRA